MPHHKNQSGFTLIELLVVIAVIIFLGGLIMASLSRAKEQGRRIQCTGQLRQLSMSMIMYSSENREALPPYFYTVQPLCCGLYAMAIKSPWSLSDIGPGATLAVLLCPSDKTPTKINTTNFSGKAISVPSSYEYNFTMFATSQRMTDVKLQTTVLLFDGNPMVSGTFGTSGCSPDPITGLIHICHQPNGSNNQQDLDIPPSALAGHLGHGDTCGQCGQGGGQGQQGGGQGQGQGQGASTNNLMSQFILQDLIRRHAKRVNAVFLDGHAESVTDLPSNSLLSQ